LEVLSKKGLKSGTWPFWEKIDKSLIKALLDRYGVPAKKGMQAQRKSLAGQRQKQTTDLPDLEEKWAMLNRKEKSPHLHQRTMAEGNSTEVSKGPLRQGRD